MLAVPGAADLLQCVGFEPRTQDGADVLLLPPEAPQAVPLAAGALQLLHSAQQTAGSPQEAASREPPAHQQLTQAAEALNENDVRRAESSQPAEAAAQASTADSIVPPAQQLGISPAQWRAEAGTGKAVSVGGVALSAARPAPQVGSPAAAATTATTTSPPTVPDSPEPFAGRNTQVCPLRPCSLCQSEPLLMHVAIRALQASAQVSACRDA